MSAFSSRSERTLSDYLPFAPRLPQDDAFGESRKRGLESRRRTYEYAFDYVSPLAMCKDVPFQDEFSIKWLWEIGERLFGVLSNLIEVESDPYLRKKHREKHLFFKGLTRAATFNVDGTLQVLQEAIEMSGAITRAESVEEFATLFRAIGIPPIHRDYRRDEVFAEMRLAGPNPVMLRQLDRLSDIFHASDMKMIDDRYQNTIRPRSCDSLDAAAKDGRLYYCDYKVLEGLEKSDFPIEKFLYAPIAVFVVTKGGQLAPVAIQCKQPGSPDNPVFTPGDGYNWRIAKTIVGMADGNVHESVSHLAHTHLFMEPFVMATERQLSSRHPLSVLLRPHFEGTLHINDLAQRYLIADHGGVHRLCNGSIESIRGAAVMGVQQHSFNENWLPRALLDRRVADSELLPNYAYRDDARLYWDAINNWVHDFLSIYYRSNIDVQKDGELRNWCNEIVTLGKVKDFGENERIDTFDYLVDAITMIIFTSSVQHAAVNFPQYDVMSYAMAMPLGIYGPAPTSKTGATEQDYLNILPPLELANLQMCLGYGLGTLHYTEIADYPIFHFKDLRVQKPLRRFQQRIKEVGRLIAQRNTRRRPYSVLMPEGVPQSINI